MLWLVPAPAWSQPGPDAAEFPAWLVPVVRVLEDGRVVPTTGVVLAEESVLVPIEFVAGGEALVALDGGADLANHGRSATVSGRMPLAGLAVLEVPGLRRPAPRLSTGPLRDGQGVLLQALSPPERLARGEARVRRPARVVQLEDGMVTLDPSTPLPNVTGVLVDGCGQWVGYSASRGASSMATSSATLYQWVPELLSVLSDAGFLLDAGDCAVDEVVPTASPQPPPDPPVAAGPVPDAASQPSKPDSGDASSEAATETPHGNRDTPELTADPEPYSGPSLAPALPSDAPSEPVAEDSGPLGRVLPWTLGALGVALVGFVLYRSRRSAPSTAAEQVVFLLESESQRLLIPARDGRVDVTVGRFEVDLVIEGGAVSRRHARLFGTVKQLQLMDLASTNGTRVNGQPCAARVAVSVAPGDRVQFGDQVFTLHSAEGGRA